MSDAPVFQWLCEALHAETPLDELETRGTVRIVVRHLGLDPRTLEVEAVGRMLAEVLPEELRLRGVDEADALCERLGLELRKRFGA